MAKLPKRHHQRADATCRQSELGGGPSQQMEPLAHCEKAHGCLLARSLSARRENIGATIASLENLRALKTGALDTTEREVA
jgi:hypothetical protein